MNETGASPAGERAIMRRHYALGQYGIGDHLSVQPFDIFLLQTIPPPGKTSYSCVLGSFRNSIDLNLNHKILDEILGDP